MVEHKCNKCNYLAPDRLPYCNIYSAKLLVTKANTYVKTVPNL